MKPSLLLLASLILRAAPAFAAPVTAPGHPMQYSVSLPAHWHAGRDWPVLVIAEAAEKEFEANLARFVAARGERPYILVAPYIVTNGSAGQRDPAVYPYSPATWDRIDRDGICSFDLGGIDAVLADVRQRYHGEARIYLTGFEAGAHLVWSMVLNQPERLAAAIPIAGNYRSRC